MRKVILFGLCGLVRLSAFGECGDLVVSAEYLYWKPTNISVSLGTITRQDGATELETEGIVDPSYRSGVRGELSWLPPCSPVTFIGRYTYVEPQQHRTFLNETRAVQPVFSSRPLAVQLPYHAGDILAAYPLCFGGLRFNLLAGGHILYWALDTRGNDGFSDFQTHSRFAGGGASVGVSTLWEIWCGLQSFVEARFGLLHGSVMQASWRGSEVQLPISFQAWTRELDLRLGLRYDCRVGCEELGLSFGWESRSYLDFPRLVVRVTQSGISDVGRDIGGPFLGVSGTF